MSIKETENNLWLNHQEIERGQTILNASNLSLSYGAEDIIEDASFNLNMGDRIALIGPNGVGKSSLVNIILDRIKPDSGIINVSKNVKIGYLPQTIGTISEPGEHSIKQFMLSGKGLDILEEKMEKLTNKMSSNSDGDVLKSYGNIQELYEQLGGYQSEADIKRFLAGVGLSDRDIDDPVAFLSGGQKTRLLLARVLYSNPDLLLLDEPSNHLDREVLIWLKGYLRNFKGAALIVSHDKDFLDEVVNQVFRLNEFTHGLEKYTGNYSECLESIKEQKRLAIKIRKVQEKELARLWKTVNKWRQRSKNAPVAKRKEREARSLEKQLVRVPKDNKKLKFHFSPERKSSEVVMQMSQIAKSFGENHVIQNLSFKIRRGEVLAILGPNGAGKTTLIKILVGELQSDKGNVSVDQLATIGYYAQEHEGLNQKNSVLDEIRDCRPSLPEWQLRSVLGSFLLTGDIAHRQVKTLSAGEKTKLVLCKLLLQGPNTLVLDEPTNHLDTPAKSALSKTLSEYGGTIIITSHDEELLHYLNPDRILMMPEEKLITKNY